MSSVSKSLSVVTSFLVLIITLCGGELTINKSMGGIYKFPPNFLIGCASASYQVEGGWNADDKGENIWDHLTHTQPEKIKNRDNGDVACDSYHKYKEDVQLIKEVGFAHYRFSILWSRVLPTGHDNVVSKAGLAYYHSLIDELKANGIEPMVTLYHWDLPQPLQELGGWANPLMADYFESYARVVFKEFGPKVKWWITINEPFEVIQGYGEAKYAPMLYQHGVADYLAAHTLLRAHAKAYHLYDSTFRPQQKGQIGITLNCRFVKPLNNTKEDELAAIRSMEFECGLFANPIFTVEGDYPKIVRERVDYNSKREGRSVSRLPVFTPEEIKLLRGSSDFFGLNHYTSRLATSGLDPLDPSVVRDSRAVVSSDPSWRTGQSPWLKVVPWGFRGILNRIRTEYNNPPVFITENGYSSEAIDKDIDRIQYYHVPRNTVKRWKCGINHLPSSESPPDQPNASCTENSRAECSSQHHNNLQSEIVNANENSIGENSGSASDAQSYSIFDLSDDSNLEESTETDLEPLYDGSPVSTDLAVMAILQYYVNNNLSKQGLNNLLQLLDTLLPSPHNLPKSKYHLEKLVNKFAPPVQHLRHEYCMNCNFYIGHSDSEENLDAPKSDMFNCPICSSPSKKGFFITFNLHELLKNFLENGEASRHIIPKNNLRDGAHMTSSINDVTDGYCYSDLKRRLKMESTDLTLIWNTDGVPVFKSSQAQLWPIQFSIAEISPKIRQNFILVCGLWFGHQKPDMNTFLRPFAKDLASLATDGVRWYSAQLRKHLTSRVIAPLSSLDAVAKASVMNVHQDYLEEMLKALYEDGCNIIGYTAWSIMDNFEWLSGYSQRFGLYYVDFNDPNRPRKKKQSAEYFKKMIASRELPDV